ncbi:uncharacterized protein MKK02DRAFT_41121 [Dioszegia hungarica]|uniref:RlpA-like protein double-psi beta-barrel domain-containing protein n=1 Tax=Dioszegia hungarica TaxID=4972 RepID=A0AA38H5C1_9TREE|nr:uncharacterized protein MKK02DRAFT_41121 [Dioszegia hungarica]KAI9632809.1 hypothetical protein MKK02DRAFT_41121 [Dioszegia hungarica]
MRPTSSFITFQPLFVLLTLFSCFTLSIASPMPAFDPGTASLVDGGGPIAGRDMVSAGGLAVERRQAQIYMGRATIYEPGLGACGRVTRATDLVGAIPPAQFGSGFPGHKCFKRITVQSGGITLKNVQIVDQCIFCAAGGLDLSQAAFTRFAPVAAGMIDVVWYFE